MKKILPLVLATAFSTACLANNEQGFMLVVELPLLR
jgi:hypothetical protein